MRAPDHPHPRIAHLPLDQIADPQRTGIVDHVDGCDVAFYAGEDVQDLRLDAIARDDDGDLRRVHLIASRFARVPRSTWRQCSYRIRGWATRPCLRSRYHQRRPAPQGRWRCPAT